MRHRITTTYLTRTCLLGILTVMVESSACSSATIEPGAGERVVTESSASTSYQIFYAPEHVGNINGRAFAAFPLPINTLNMFVWGAGANGLSQAISSWNVGTYSGVTSPSPFGTYQRGINDSWGTGQTAVQMTDQEMGGMINTFSNGGVHDMRDPASSIFENMQANYQFGFPPLPWTHTTSRLRFAFNLKVPADYAEGGAVTHVLAVLLLKDGVTGKLLYLAPAIYDRRPGIFTESVSYDQHGVAMAQTFFGDTTTYCSKYTSSSGNSTGATWSNWQWYDVTVSKAQLQTVINAANAANAGLSTNIEGYSVQSITVLDEIYWPIGNAWSAMGVRDLYLMEIY